MKKIILAALMLSGCVSDRITLPTRSATEQMLISEAANAAALAMHLKLPEGRTAYLDAVNFEGGDGKYAASAIRQSLLQQGNVLVDARDNADIIVEVRVGALSIDSASRLIGLPAFRMAQFLMPTYSLERTRNTGVAKFSLFAYDRQSGKLIAVVADISGYSQRTMNRINSGVISWVSGAGTIIK